MNNSTQNDTPENQIIVNIEKIQNSTIIEGKNFFESELDQAIALIKYILHHLNNNQVDNNRNKNCKNEENSWFHQHNAIAILGPRGVGKTSFILTLRDRIENCEKYEKYEKYSQYKDLKKKLIWLPNLDPTRMEENEMFLVTVIANILKEIRKTNSELDFKVGEELQSLSRDFAVLASTHVHEEQWKNLVDDPDSFAYTVLNNAHSGISLARSFHKFLDACKRALNNCNENTVFVQPIDDVDTAIKQGWPILETIRKYLATPHLITIVTGDIDLYETLVRKQQLDKLSHLLENESRMGGNVRKIGDQIAQLTEQYLAKVIPSHLRIRLKSIADYITQEAFTTKKDSVCLKFDENNGQPLSEIYADFVHHLFGLKYGDFSSLDPISGTNRLFPYITRDLVRFFKALKPWYDAKVNQEKGIDTKIQDDEMEKTLDTLIQIFSAALYNRNINSNDLSLLKEGRHLEWLGDYCLGTRQEIKEFWRLFPRYDDEEWNYRALLLHAFLYQGWKKAKSPEKSKEKKYYPHRPMSYGIKVLLPCLLADSRDLTGEKLSEMKRFLNIGNTERHFWMAIRSLAYRLQDSAQDWSKYGSGYVIVNVPKQAKGKEFRIHWDTPFAWFCQFMYRPNNGKALYADILIALARLVDVLREGPDCIDENQPDCTDKQLANIFSLFIQDRPWYLHSPQSESNINGSFKASGKLMSPGLEANYELNVDGEFASKADHATDYKKSFILKNGQFKGEIFTYEMSDWIKKMRKLGSKEEILPPPIIARIWKRFIDNLEYIRSDIGIKIEKSNVDLVDVLKCWVKAFLNASVIEEVIFWSGFTKHDIKIENIRLPSGTNNNDVFFENLGTLKSKSNFDKICYTKAWTNCPLFLLFLDDMPDEIRQEITKCN